MNPKDIPYLIYDSIKSLVLDLVKLLGALKQARTWSFILYATFFLAVYYKNFTLMKIALPAILVLYIMRRQKEPEYNIAVKKRAFLKNDEVKIKEYYEKYKRECYYSKKDALSYDDYKDRETKKLEEKNKILNN